jgi:hypothetical protein
MAPHPLRAGHQHSQDFHINRIDQGQVERGRKFDLSGSFWEQGQWKIFEAPHDPPAFAINKGGRREATTCDERVVDKIKIFKALHKLRIGVLRKERSKD